jgi:dihydrodipicolinate reductase
MKKIFEKLILELYIDNGIKEFANGKSFEDFYNKCENGGWLLSLFKQANPEKLREFTLAKGYCANEFIHLIKDERSRKAIKAAIDFGNGKINENYLEKYSNEAYNAVQDIIGSAGVNINNKERVSNNIDYVSASIAAHASVSIYQCCNATFSNDKENQLKMANICKKYLPIEIWDII